MGGTHTMSRRESGEGRPVIYVQKGGAFSLL